MIYLGEYRELNSNRPDLPSIVISPQFPLSIKDTILSYLKDPKKITAAMPSSKYDIYTGDHIDMECLAYTDGKFWWDYETIYYFEKYNMELPDYFLLCALKNSK